MPKILIVGCGMTGAATFHYLCSLYPNLRSSIQIWEAASAIGGRMSTDRFLTGFSSCDLGAQYITKNSDFYDDVYEHLNSKSILVPLRDNSLVEGMRPEHMSRNHFIAPQGTSSIVGALAQGANLQLGKQLLALNHDKGHRKILATSLRTLPAADNVGSSAAVEVLQETEEFDAVMVGILAPQILALRGNFMSDMIVHSPTLQSVRSADINRKSESDGDAAVDANTIVEPTPTSIDLIAALNSVRYSSRFALALHFELTAGERANVLSSVSWRGKYVFDDDIVRYISIENFKYDHDIDVDKVSVDSDSIGLKGSAVAIDGSRCTIATTDGAKLPLSVLVHTSVPYGIEKLKLRPEGPSCNTGDTFFSSENDREIHAKLLQQWEKEIIDSIVPRVFKMIPMLSAKTLRRTYLHTWQYSQVSGAPAVLGADAVLLQPNPSTSVATVPAIPVAEGTTVLPAIVLAGDAFTESNFEGCLKSAKQAATYLGSVFNTLE